MKIYNFSKYKKKNADFDKFITENKINLRLNDLIKEMEMKQKRPSEILDFICEFQNQLFNYWISTLTKKEHFKYRKSIEERCCHPLTAEEEKRNWEYVNNYSYADYQKKLKEQIK